MLNNINSTKIKTKFAKDDDFGQFDIYCLLKGYGNDADTIVKYKVSVEWIQWGIEKTKWRLSNEEMNWKKVSMKQ